jgi:hypothetical protein
MPTPIITPVTLLALPDWQRHFRFPFGSFAEFSANPPPTITAISVTADPGFTVGTPAVGPGARTVAVPVSGGTPGNSYNISCEVTLSTGDVLSIPGVYNPVTAAPGGIAPATPAKRADWDRHYVFPFGRVFAEFNTSPPPTIVGTPVFACQPANDGSVLTSQTPQVAGTSVVVFIGGGHPGQSYLASCRATLSTGDVLSIPALFTVTS